MDMFLQLSFTLCGTRGNIAVNRPVPPVRREKKNRHNFSTFIAGWKPGNQLEWFK